MFGCGIDLFFFKLVGLEIVFVFGDLCGFGLLDFVLVIIERCVFCVSG